MKISIRLKTTLLIAFFSLAIAATAMICFSVITTQNNENQYKRTAANVAQTTSQVVDIATFKTLKAEVQTTLNGIENKVTADNWGSEEWLAYSQKFDAIKETEAYKELFAFTTKIDQANGAEVDCINLVYLDPNIECYVYLVDSEADIERRCPPGCLDTLDPEDMPLLSDPTLGIAPRISNTEEYGGLVFAGAPVYDGETVIGYALADVSMSTIKGAERTLILQLSLCLAGITIAAIVINLLIVHFSLFRPLYRINNIARSYKNHTPEENHEIFAKLQVRSKDELGELASSLIELEHDVYSKINELTMTNHKLVESQHVAEEMAELANKDALTGVRNKAAYLQWTQRIDTEISANVDYEFGIAMIDLNDLKKINDEHGHKDGDTAIKTLSELICHIFVHSPVFRVGGDEFCVILHGQDYKNIDMLMSSFNGEIYRLARSTNLPAGKRISAAIGFARFNRAIDQNTQSVFERADQAMYERKRAMKQGN